MSIYGIYLVAFIAILTVFAIAGLSHRRILTPEMHTRRTRRRLVTLGVIGIAILSFTALWAFGTVRAIGGFGDPKFISAVVRIRASGRFHDLDQPLAISFDYGNDNPEDRTVSTVFENVTLRIVLLQVDSDDVVLYEEALTDFYDAASECTFRSFGYFTYDFHFLRSIHLDIDLAEADEFGWLLLELVFAPGETGSSPNDMTVETRMRYEIHGSTIRLFSVVEEGMVR